MLGGLVNVMGLSPRERGNQAALALTRLKGCKKVFIAHYRVYPHVSGETGPRTRRSIPTASVLAGARSEVYPHVSGETMPLCLFTAVYPHVSGETMMQC